MAAVTTTTYAAGDVVKGRPLKNGEPQAVHKGIVLGPFGSDPKEGVIVWWYGLGPASMQTTSLMFPRELKAAGSVDDFSEAVCRRVERGAVAFDKAHAVGLKVASRRLRLRNARRQAAQVPTRFKVTKLRSGWAVEDTVKGGCWTGLVHVGAVQLRDRMEREALAGKR
jgi:hypothetical protein